MKIFKNKNIYLDNAGATPLDKDVESMISSYQKDFFANPSSIHSIGVEARKVVDFSRVKIAKLIKAHANEIIFTSSGTTSDALAIIGVIKKYNSNKENKNKPHIVTTNIEHPAIMENCIYLEKQGLAEVTYVKVGEDGVVDPKDVKDALRDNTILVSIMYANNEIGSIQPIREIAKVVRHYRKERLISKGYSKDFFKDVSVNFPLFHTDACQAMNYLPLDNIDKLGVDMLSFNGSKIYGPKGIGVLYKKRGVAIDPLFLGGGQEYGLYSGTENVAFIIGIAFALEKTFSLRETESIRLTGIRDYAIDKLLSMSTNKFKVTLNGGRDLRLPNNINISISNISSELLVLELDAHKISVSEKSSCHSSDDNSSYVIRAIRKSCGRKKDSTEGSLRISLGRHTKKGDIDILISSLKSILNKYKSLK